MKQWLTRLFGGAATAAPAQTTPSHSIPGPAFHPGAAPAPDAAAAGDSAPAFDSAAAPHVDLAFYRWLTDPVRGDADARAEAGILAELARLARDPAAAGALVPRVPAVVPQLLKSLRDDSVSSGELARQIARDAVLVAEVIREANSPYFRSGRPITTIDGAVMVLGENGLRILLARVAFRPVINMQGGRAADRIVRLVAPRLWLHADACALAASLLAPELGADPFEAYLTGLVLNVGLLVAFRLIEQLGHPVVPQSDAFCATLLEGARDLSAGIAAHWELPPFAAAAIVRAGRPASSLTARPLAEALGRADLLAKLRLLLDAGIFGAGDAPLPALLAGPAGRHFERLGVQQG
ncbi:HDOD domain-containing protein [Herbaspirillum sp. SJZ107]|uniref:HDOD domain-containing protein n=1 Tax=Herbaspirillum sp. SJZ107 TaxID=2572881 RepID=UPI00114F2CDB|nr:HDOD domain-containing protein [Herbaspirillum sp. SJZ107]TQK11237.1 HDOD domain-containing protein [Herbaspirillum sp. SJZ107]